MPPETIESRNGSDQARRASSDRERRPSALHLLRQADMLLRGGRSDEDVERLTGVTLGEILELRARQATSPAAELRRDRFPGRRWWGRPA